jgi:hypothetical protein
VYRYVNRINTDNGTHLDAFLDGITKGVNKVFKKNYLPKYIYQCLTAVVSVRLKNPIFSPGEYILTNKEVRPWIVKEVQTAVIEFLQNNSTAAHFLEAKIINNMIERNVNVSFHKVEKNAREDYAWKAVALGKESLKRKDYDTAVWEFFRATRLDHGNKKYHAAFADALRKRGLKPLLVKDGARAEELYQRAKNCRQLLRYDIYLEAALLGHLDAAYALRQEFIISVWTTSEANALTELLLEANYPPVLCAVGENYIWGWGGYRKDIQKGYEYFQKALDLGYKRGAERLKHYKDMEQREIEQAKASKEFAAKNPPLKGRKKKEAEKVLAELLRSLARKATRITLNAIEEPESKSLLPKKQILTSHIGGYPYFEKGSKWPYGVDDEEKPVPLDFIFQVFQDEANSVALPEGVKLLQLFYDWEIRDGIIILYRELHTEKAVYGKNLKSFLEYRAIKLETVDMLPDYFYAKDLAPEAVAIAEKILPGIFPSKGEKVYNRLCDSLGFKQPLLDSYLGGFAADMSNSSSPVKPTDKNHRCLFQLYIPYDKPGIFDWKHYMDAMLYANYNIKIKKANMELVIDYD